jgi:hypothetical protein
VIKSQHLTLGSMDHPKIDSWRVVAEQLHRLKFLHITPEPKPISVGIVALKGRLSPAAEKFWQCAKEAASAKNNLIERTDVNQPTTRSSLRRRC